MALRTQKKPDSLNATPPVESEEDRLIRIGMAMCFANDMEGSAPNRKALEAILVDVGDKGNPTAFPPDLRRRFADLGTQDPRPFVERLKRTCEKLLEKHPTEGSEERKLVKNMQTTLADLELVLTVKRYGGRPKGTRKKVSPEEITKIRRWKEGDRSWVKGSSVADVAKELNVSRQTIYTILEEIKKSQQK